MAGAAGKVQKTSPFASFVIRDWQPWMTQAVIEHAAGTDIPALRVRYGKSDQHLRNIMNTQQAKEIISTMHSRALAVVHDKAVDQIKAANAKALERVNSFLNDDELAQKAPATVWQLSLKTMDTLKLPSQTPTTQFNQQNNYFLPPDVLEKLKLEAQAGLSNLTEIPKPVYESPSAPVIRSPQSVFGSGIREFANPGEDGPAVPLQLRTGTGD